MTTEEHIDYWIQSADRDLETAETLFASKRYDWCLFIAHLVLEKGLKAVYVRDNNNSIPPRIHNLVKLAEKTSLTLSDEQKLFFDKVSDFNLEVRYPDYRNEFYRECTMEYAETNFTKIKEHYQWLKSLLKSETS